MPLSENMLNRITLYWRQGHKENAISCLYSFIACFLILLILLYIFDTLNGNNMYKMVNYCLYWISMIGYRKLKNTLTGGASHDTIQ